MNIYAHICTHIRTYIGLPKIKSVDLNKLIWFLVQLKVYKLLYNWKELPGRSKLSQWCVQDRQDGWLTEEKQV